MANRTNTRRYRDFLQRRNLYLTNKIDEESQGNYVDDKITIRGSSKKIYLICNGHEYKRYYDNIIERITRDRGSGKKIGWKKSREMEALNFRTDTQKRMLLQNRPRSVDSRRQQTTPYNYNILYAYCKVDCLNERPDVRWGNLEDLLLRYGLPSQTDVYQNKDEWESEIGTMWVSQKYSELDEEDGTTIGIVCQILTERRQQSWWIKTNDIKRVVADVTRSTQARENGKKYNRRFWFEPNTEWKLDNFGDRLARGKYNKHDKEQMNTFTKLISKRGLFGKKIRQRLQGDDRAVQIQTDGRRNTYKKYLEKLHLWKIMQQKILFTLETHIIMPFELKDHVGFSVIDHYGISNNDQNTGWLLWPDPVENVERGTIQEFFEEQDYKYAYVEIDDVTYDEGDIYHTFTFEPSNLDYDRELLNHSYIDAIGRFWMKCRTNNQNDQGEIQIPSLETKDGSLVGGITEVKDDSGREEKEEEVSEEKKEGKNSNQFPRERNLRRSLRNRPSVDRYVP